MSEPLSSWAVAESPVPWRLAAGDLPDVNVWVALSLAGHPSHAVAMRYWQTACDEQISIWFCRATMMGLVRLLSQVRMVGNDAMPLPQAMALYRQWVATPEVALLPEPPGLDGAIEQILRKRGEPPPACLWTDICLAATAQSAGLRMVTFDRDFERFGLERCLVLPGA